MGLDLGSNLRNQYRKPTYFYRVSQHVSAYNEKRELVDSFDDKQDFQDSDLIRARQLAFIYIADRHVIFPDKFVYEFLSPEEHFKDPNKPHARYSYSISLVQYYSEDEFLEYIIDGDSTDENLIGREEELQIFQELGLK
jgi:hypothetical protein